jgi:nitroreductase
MMSRRNLLIGAGGLAVVGGATYFATQGSGYESAATELRALRKSRGDMDLEYLAHYATLAANSHNTQAWRFRRIVQDIAILPDLSRSTPIVDPDNHHLFVSLGCACENLVLAAAADGKSAVTNFIDEGDGEVRVSLAAGTRVHDPLFAAIHVRQCTRSEYDGRAVGQSDLAALAQAGNTDGCRIVLLNDRPKINDVLDLIVAGNTSQTENPAFVKELKSWLRFNSAKAIETGDGLYSACSANPTLPTWLGRAMFDRVFKAKAENEKCIKQIQTSSGLAVFVGDKDDKEYWVKAGRSYQHFALQATVLGLKHAFLNQAVEVQHIRVQLASLLGIPDKRPSLIVRFGYANPMPMSMRRPLADVILKDNGVGS